MYQEEKEALAKECHGLKVQLLDNDRTQARLTDTVSHLEAQLAKADDERTATKAELEQLQESADRYVRMYTHTRTHAHTHTHSVASVLHTYTYIPCNVHTLCNTSACTLPLLLPSFPIRSQNAVTKLSEDTARLP